MTRTWWISGWGVPPGMLRPFADRVLPGGEHIFVPPTAQALALVQASDRLVGWSLGAHLILRSLAEEKRLPERVFLLAPFLAFCAEDQMGGRCARAQVVWLSRWISRDPLKALNDFYQRAGLGLSCHELPYSAPDLLWGLAQLTAEPTTGLRSLSKGRLPRGWHAAIGASDSLLEAEKVRGSLPASVIVPGAGHHPGILIESMKEQFNAV